MKYVADREPNARRRPGILLTIVFLSINGCAQKSAEQQLAALDKQYKDVSDRYMAAFKASLTKDEEEEAYRTLSPNRDFFTKRYLQIAERFPNSKVAASALAWLAINGDSKASADAVNKLFRRHSVSAEMAKVVLTIRHDEVDPTTEQRLLTVITKSPHKQVRGAARYGLAYLYQDILTHQKSLSNVEFGEKFQANYSKATIEYWKTVAVEDSEIENLLNLALQDLQEDNSEFGLKIANRCRSMLFERNHLQPGQQAPETVGTDLTGKPMRLSDFRGKVVLLSFWGDW